MSTSLTRLYTTLPNDVQVAGLTFNGFVDALHRLAAIKFTKLTDLVSPVDDIAVTLANESRKASQVPSKGSC